MQYFTELNSHVAEILHAWLSSCQKWGFCFDLFFVLSCSSQIVWSQREGRNPCLLEYIFLKCSVCSLRSDDQKARRTNEKCSLVAWSKFSACGPLKISASWVWMSPVDSSSCGPKFQCTEQSLHSAEHQPLCSVLATCGTWDVLPLRSKLTSLTLNLLLLDESLDYNQGFTGTGTLVMFLFVLFLVSVFFSSFFSDQNLVHFVLHPLCSPSPPHPPPPSWVLLIAIMVFLKQEWLNTFIVPCSCWCLFLQSYHP